MSAVPCFPACQSQQLRSPVHDEYSVASPRARSRPHGRPENDVSGSRRPLELEPLLSAQRGVCTAVLGVSFHRNQPLFLVTTVQLPIAQRNRFATTRHKQQTAWQRSYKSTTDENTPAQNRAAMGSRGTDTATTSPRLLMSACSWRNCCARSSARVVGFCSGSGMSPKNANTEGGKVGLSAFCDPPMP